MSLYDIGPYKIAPPKPEPVSYGEFYQQSYLDSVKVANQDARIKQLVEAYDDVNDRIRQATGEELFNPFTTSRYGRGQLTQGDVPGDVMATYRSRAQTFGRSMLSTAEEQADLWKRRVSEFKQKYADKLPWDELIDEPENRVAKQMFETRQRTNQMAEGMGWDLIGQAAGLAGGFLGSFESPVDTAANLAPIGTTRAAYSLLRNALVNAAANAAVQAPLSLAKLEDYRKAGLPYGFQVWASEVGAAALVGGGLDLAIRGPARALVSRYGRDVGPDEFLSRNTPRGGVVFDAIDPTRTPSTRISEAPQIDPEIMQRAQEGDIAAQRQLADSLGVGDDPAVKGALDYLEGGGKLDAEAWSRLRAMNVDDARGMRFMADIMAGRVQTQMPEPLMPAREPMRHAEAVELARTSGDDIRSMIDEALEPRQAQLAADAFEAGFPRVVDAVKRLLDGDRSPEAIRAAVSEVVEAEGGAQRFADRVLIHSGRGNAIEMATAIRRDPTILDDAVPQTERVIQAMSMARMADDAWERILAGDLPPALGAHIADRVAPQFQGQAVETLVKARPESLEEAAAILDETVPDVRVPEQERSASGIADPNGPEAQAQLEALRAEAGEAVDQAMALPREKERLEQEVEDLRAQVAKEDDERLASISKRDELDPSPEARKARAEEMGFDTSVVYYHGSPDFRPVRSSMEFEQRQTNRYNRTSGEYENAPQSIYFTTDRRVASTYADDRRAFDYQNAEPEIFESYLRLGNTLEINAGGQKFSTLDRSIVKAQIPETQRNEFDRILESYGNSTDGKTIRTGDLELIANMLGYDSFRLRNVKDAYDGGGKPTTVVAVFDPSNIRSVNAMFDPAEERSANLLASLSTRERLADAQSRLDEITDTLDARAGRLTTELITQRAAMRRQREVMRAISDAVQFARRITPEGTEVTVRDKIEYGGFELDASSNLRTGDIELSIRALDPSAQMGHEAVHTLVTKGLISPEEVSTLAAMARERGLFTQEAEYRQAYADRLNLDRLIDEEAAAAMIEARIAGRDTGPANTAIERIRRFIERLRQLLTSGQFRSREDIIDAVLSGEMAQRDAVQSWMRENQSSRVQSAGGKLYAIRRNGKRKLLPYPYSYWLHKLQNNRVTFFFEDYILRRPRPGINGASLLAQSFGGGGGLGREASLDGKGTFIQEWMWVTSTAEPRTVSIRDKNGNSMRVEISSSRGSMTYEVYDGTASIGRFYVRSNDAFENTLAVADANVEAGYRRKGIATAVYDLIENDVAMLFGGRIAPLGADNLTADGKAFWANRRPGMRMRGTDADRMASITDRDTGQSMRRDLDALGYYSQALEAARGLKQAKGTPEQMLAQLKKAGVKDAEIEATGLQQFLDGAGKSITRDQIVAHLEANRVGLKEAEYKPLTNGGIDASSPYATPDVIRAIRNAADEDEMRPIEMGVDEVEAVISNDYDTYEALRQQFPDLMDRDDWAERITESLFPRGVRYTQGAKWQNYSLDSLNPTYRETVLHLPGKEELSPSQMIAAAEEQDAALRRGDMETYEQLRAARAENMTRIPVERGFQSGHFPEPNIIGHMMTSMVQHEGRPTYLIDQIQSDWGQKLRDGGVRDEAKIEQLRAEVRRAEQQFDTPENDAFEAEVAAFGKERGLNVGDGVDALSVRYHLDRIGQRNDSVGAQAREMLERDPAKWAAENYPRLKAELNTAEAATPGNPLVNTTDQWVNTTLRRAIRQAAEADAEYIAVPSGDTVLSYNPGDTKGMRGFYGNFAPDDEVRQIRAEIEAARARGDEKTALGYERAMQFAGQQAVDGIVPKNLRNILRKLDKASPDPQRVGKLETPTSGMKGAGFTVFPLTPEVKRKVMEEGQAMFSIAKRKREIDERTENATPLEQDMAQVYSLNTIKDMLEACRG